MRLAHWPKRILWALAGLLLLALVWLAYLALRGLPTLDGEIRVQGLSGPVKVTRDTAEIGRAHV